MMRFFVFLMVCFSLAVPLAKADKAYMDRFNTYSQWSQNLPEEPKDGFIQFIDENKPLANKLRERWLYHLAQKKDWVSYSQYYQASSDVNLQCFAHLSDYYLGKTEQAMAEAQRLWLNGDSLPGACTILFEYLMKSEAFNDNLISERIKLALDKQNVPLVRYLLKHYSKPRLLDEKRLLQIQQNPKTINSLTPSDLNSAFYLYGLKRLVKLNINTAIHQWETPQTKKILSVADQQSFLVFLTIYMAIRNHEDTPVWFKKIKRAFYNDALLDWQIRLALKRGEWQSVITLIQQFQDKDNPCWQYWLARAEEETGHREEAKAHYLALSATRNYYGFLASLRLGKPFTFQNEPIKIDPSLLIPYKPFTELVKSLYQTNQLGQASRLLNDFVSELPKEDKSALVSWIASELKWHDKSVSLSSNEMLNNHLLLRFPLAYLQTVNTYAKNYHIPQAFIYAIIRQESGFRRDVVSSAGARGLMQIMPATANQVAKKEKITYKHQDQLFSSEQNINIGVAYLNYLAARFHQHPILMAAAYNAGPSQVNYWLKHHTPTEIDIWIETLPWHETRNYLKNVISFYAVYQYRMNHPSNLKTIMQDF